MTANALLWLLLPALAVLLGCASDINKAFVMSSMLAEACDAVKHTTSQPSCTNPPTKLELFCVIVDNYGGPTHQ